MRLFSISTMKSLKRVPLSTKTTDRVLKLFKYVHVIVLIQTQSEVKCKKGPNFA